MTFTDIFMPIGPWGGAKMAKKSTYHTFFALFQSDCVLESSAAALYTSSKMTGVLETSAVALGTFTKMPVSLIQAQRHLALFER